MRRALPAFVLLVLVLAAALPAAAAPEVMMTGDARIHGNFWSHYNFTGWNAAGNRTGDTFAIWQRFRLRTDFIASEGLKFRLGIRVNNTAWGNGAYTVDNPAVSIDVYQAFLQFYWPGTGVEFTIGQQDIDLPISNVMLSANPVMGGIRGPAALVKIPVVENAFDVIAGYYRFLDANRDMDPTTTQVPDEFDAFMLSLPVTMDGFQFTPWSMLGLAGRSANYAGTGVGGAGANQTMASNIMSAGTALAPAGMTFAQNVYWWLGGSFAFTKLDPFKFYADIIVGQGQMAGRAKNHRQGLFFDVAAEYTGFDALTPQLTFWYATGEDSSTRNGSERLAVVTSAWGPGNSFLFDCSQEFARGFMGVDYLGAWGFVASLDNISFIENLTSRISFTYAQGMNSPQAIRAGIALWGYGNYFQMGRELATGESIAAVNIDAKYDIYRQLALILETGWAHGNFKTSVWGPRLVNEARGGDAWKFALGLRYKF
jgi:hypothetical protein